MKTSVDKRAHGRHIFTADIVFSYFNKEHSYIAQTMNFGRGGMCFKSNLFLQPGQTVFIRLKKFIQIALVLVLEKDCVQYPSQECDTDDTNYGVGVKYVASVY